jgi:hydrogenase maturation factor HypF (carbamoyltransferase family)
MIQEKTYCESCLENLDDDEFDYRYDFPICLDCANGK